MTLIGDGSAVNVLPLKTAKLLNLKESDFAPTSQTVRGFDGTVRRISGIVTLIVCAKDYLCYLDPGSENRTLMEVGY